MSAKVVVSLFFSLALFLCLGVHVFVCSSTPVLYGLGNNKLLVRCLEIIIFKFAKEKRSLTERFEILMFILLEPLALFLCLGVHVFVCSSTPVLYGLGNNKLLVRCLEIIIFKFAKEKKSSLTERFEILMFILLEPP